MSKKSVNLKVPNLENIKEILTEEGETSYLERNWIKRDKYDRPLSAPRKTYADVVKELGIVDKGKEAPLPEWIQSFLATNPAYEYVGGKLREKNHLYNPDKELEEKEIIMPPTSSLYFNN